MLPIDVEGVYTLGPENFILALLRVAGKDRVLPVWLPTLEGAQLAARLSGREATRPTTMDLLAEVVKGSAGGVQSVAISSYYNGVFMATVTLGDGSTLDARTSDALALAAALDVAVEVDEAVVAQAAVRLSAEDARNFFDLDMRPRPVGSGPGAEDASASGDAAADAEFEQLMRDLGVDEEELGDESIDDGDDV